MTPVLKQQNMDGLSPSEDVIVNVKYMQPWFWGKGIYGPCMRNMKTGAWCLTGQ